MVKIQKKVTVKKKETTKASPWSMLMRPLRAVHGLVFKKSTEKIKKVINKKHPKSKEDLKKIINKEDKKEAKKEIEEKGLRLHKSINNPIIKPRLYSWESRATLNPTAFISKGKIHILYRAIGEDDVSVLGYATSFDGYNLEERPTHYVYRRRGEYQKIGIPILYSSGGGWSGGCEDPRATVIGSTVYVLYNAFDGWSSVRVAMISISLEDLKNKRWNWTEAIFLSPPGEVQKAWTLFPEKINGQFAIIYNIWPCVSIQYFDSFEQFKKGEIKVPQYWNRWFNNFPNYWTQVNAGVDGGRWVDPKQFEKNIWKDVQNDLGVRNVGPAPIKTEDGWLVIFHAIEGKDPGKYKLFAMLLDLEDPIKVLFKSKKPILEPEEEYELNGWQGMTYSCGAVIRSGRLFVYYGGGDKVVGVASIRLSELLTDLKEDKIVKLKNKKVIKLVKIRK